MTLTEAAVCSKKTSSLKKINSFVHDLFLCNDMKSIKECLKTNAESLKKFIAKRG